ncbi:MAG: nicotinate-nucleotide adenylyltransferase [Planctomycetota bacterium]
MARELLFGGSFDPIHVGHLIVSRFVAEQLEIDRVVLIPGANPPHKLNQVLAPAEDRLAMCRLAVADDPSFAVSDWEIRQGSITYTLHTVRHFLRSDPANTELYWLVGMDSLVELGTWYRVGELVELCTVVTAGRPGFEEPDLSGLAGPLSAEQIERLRRSVVESPLVDVSSTDIRQRVRAGKSIRYLVPEAVRAYVGECGLYV